MYTTRNYHQLWAFYLFIYFFEKEKTIFQSLSDNKDIVNMFPILGDNF